MQYKALIVDDSKLARMVMASAFRRLRPDWELIEASNGDDAINAISAHADRYRAGRLQYARNRRLGAGREDSENPSEDADGGGFRQRPGRDYCARAGNLMPPL